MEREQKNPGSNQLRNAAEKKQRISRLAEAGATSSLVVRDSEAALMWGISREALRDAPITITPRQDRQVAVVFGPDINRHIDSLAEHLKSDRGAEQRLLKKSYEDLISFCQASLNPSVDFEFNQSQRLRFSLLGEIVPQARTISEFVEAGGGAEDLIREDRMHWHSLARHVFSLLSHDRQEGLKSRGLDPNLTFEYPDE